MNYCKNDMDLDRVPGGLQKRFGDKSFAGNAALCGSSPCLIVFSTTSNNICSNCGSLKS
ncbi:hypothetical protein Sjap_008368 [Stephania japonica]|uniref:Uncharacterized protein n=1 Tax=Stephania japonica TaxID=461633 RepID=A0AAP0JPT5_9MAGN